MPDFQHLVEQHQQRIFVFAFYFLGSCEDAEEITQDTPLTLWRQGHTINPASLAAWIMRVARNACIDALRKRRSYQERVIPEREDWQLAETVANEDNPERELEANEFQRHVEQALHRLPEPCRTVVILREIQDLTYEEIQETTELPMNSVKSYLHRGRSLLRTYLRERSDDE